MSTVLENHYDPNYEPSASEIEEYGKWLGMDLAAEKHLMWLAREGLKAPLPESWKACKSEKGDLYYFNFKSGQSIWDHPMDEHFKKRLVEEREKCKTSKKSLESLSETDKENTSPPAAESKKRVVAEQPSVVVSEPSDTEKTHDNAKAPDAGASPPKKERRKSGSKMAALKTLKDRQDVAEPSANQESTSSANPEIKPQMKLQDTTATPLGPRNVNLSMPSAVSTPSVSPIPNASAQLSAISTAKRLPKVSFKDKTPAPQVPEQELAGAQEDLAARLAEAKRELEKTFNASVASARKEHEDRSAKEVEKVQSDANELIKDAKQREQRRVEKEVAALKASATERLSKLKAELEATHKAAEAKLQETHQAELEAFLEGQQRKLATAKEDCQRQVRDLSASLVDEQGWRECFNLFSTHFESLLSEREALMVVTRLQETSVSLVAARKALQNDHEVQMAAIMEQQERRVCEARRECDAIVLAEERKMRERLQEMKDLAEREQAAFEHSRREATAAALLVAEEPLRRVPLLSERALSDVVSSAIGHSSEDDEADTMPPGSPHLDEPSSGRASGGSSASSPSVSAQEIRTIVADVLKDLFARQQQQRESAAECELEIRRESHSVSDFKPVHAMPSSNPLNITLPTSFQDQHQLLDAERRRLDQAKDFLSLQRAEIDDRREGLRMARRQWKRDVLKAKADGLRSDSQKGLLLRNVHKVLEKQAAGLEHDERVLHESEGWLLAKERRVEQLSEQLNDAERAVPQRRPSLDVSSASVETAALITDFFQNESLVAGVRAPKRPQAGPSKHSHADPNDAAAEKDVSKTLQRIEKRLDKFVKVLLQAPPPPSAPKTSASLPAKSDKEKRRRSSSDRRHAAGHQRSSSSKRVDFALYQH